MVVFKISFAKITIEEDEDHAAGIFKRLIWIVTDPPTRTEKII
jgi:hypothetical protein